MIVTPENCYRVECKLVVFSAMELLVALKKECRPMLRESSKIIHLEPADSPLRSAEMKFLLKFDSQLLPNFRSQFLTVSKEESDLDGYIEMVENIATE